MTQKINMPISDDDMLDIRGHGQDLEYRGSHTTKVKIYELNIMQIYSVLIMYYLQIRHGIYMPKVCLMSATSVIWAWKTIISREYHMKKVDKAKRINSKFYCSQDNY